MSLVLISGCNKEEESENILLRVQKEGTLINCSYSNFNRSDYPEECRLYMYCVYDCNYKCSHYLKLFRDDPDECNCRCEPPKTKGEIK